MSAILTKRLYKMSDKVEPIPGFKTINVMNSNPSNEWRALSPFILKTKEGVIFENFWQGAKVYPKLYKHKEYQYRGSNVVQWEYEPKSGKNFDVLVDEKGQVNLALYSQWKDSIYQNKKWVRYPNTFKGRTECLYALDENLNKLGYIEARKKLYLNKYYESIKDLPQYKKLKQLYNKGTNLLICEVDVLDKDKKGEYGKDVNIPLTLEKLNKLLNDPSCPFGHGLCLALILISPEYD